MQGDSFYEGMRKYTVSRFNGIDETLSDVELLASNKTSVALNVSQRGGKLSNRQFGYASLPFTRPVVTTDVKRGYGMAQDNDKRYVYGFYSSSDGAALDSQNRVFNLPALTSTNVDTLNPKKLVSSTNLNGRVITADGNNLRKYSGGGTVASSLVQSPVAPTHAVGGAGLLTGVYYYKATLVDSNGNESMPSSASTSISTTAQQVDLSLVTTTLIGATNGWTHVRFYRTLAGASNASTFYLVNTTDLAIADPTTHTDNIADSTITTNPILNNNDPVISLTAADIVFQWENRVFLMGTTENGTYYGSRIRWSKLTDSKLLSSGNITSYQRTDFADITPGDGDYLIGAHAGLGGRAFIFKGDAAYAVTPTGSDLSPYRFEQISDEYGLYHHTISDMGGSIIGQHRNGIATFNGYQFKTLSNPISSTLARGLSFEANSAVYDFEKRRYYLAMCDSTFIGTFKIIDTTGHDFQEQVRNQVVVYDVKEDKWEIYPYTFIQYFKRIEDNSNNTKIMAQGSMNDFFAVTDDVFSGPSCAGVGVSYLVAPASSWYVIDTQLSIPNSSYQLNRFANKKINLFYRISTSDDKFYFIDRSYDQSTSVSPGNTVLTTLLMENYPKPTDVYGFSPVNVSGAKYLYMFDSSNGTTASPGGANTLTDNFGNYFQSNTIKNYSVEFDFDGTGESTTSAYNNFFSSGGSMSVSNFYNLSVSSYPLGASGVPSGRKYVTIPGNVKNTTQSQGTTSFTQVLDPRNVYTSPRFGMNDIETKKSFRFLTMLSSGVGTLKIRTFINGSTSPNQTIYYNLGSTLDDKTVPKFRRIDLNGAVGDFIQIELSMKKGTGEFEITQLAVEARLQGSLRNA